MTREHSVALLLFTPTVVVASLIPAQDKLWDLPSPFNILAAAFGVGAWFLGLAAMALALREFHANRAMRVLIGGANLTVWCFVLMSFVVGSLDGSNSEDGGEGVPLGTRSVARMIGAERELLGIVRVRSGEDLGVIAGESRGRYGALADSSCITASKLAVDNAMSVEELVFPDDPILVATPDCTEGTGGPDPRPVRHIVTLIESAVRRPSEETLAGLRDVSSDQGYAALEQLILGASRALDNPITCFQIKLGEMVGSADRTATGTVFVATTWRYIGPSRSERWSRILEFELRIDEHGSTVVLDVRSQDGTPRPIQDLVC
jgi:hypothetical protein